MFWHYITATPLCLGMYYYNLPKFWNALLPLPDHYHFVFFNELPLSDILEGITTTFWLFFWECISTTFSSLGMHYHHSLMFWDILLPLSDVLECISILSLSCVFGIYFYQFWCFGIYNTLPCFMAYWYYFLAFWNAFLPLHDHYHGFRMNCHSVVLGCTSISSDILEFITKCITTTFQGFGIYYYRRFLMFWNVLQLSDVLECITSTFRRFGMYYYFLVGFFGKDF